MLAQADAFAKRVSTVSKTTEDQVDRAIRVAYGRPAHPVEIATLSELARKRGLATVGRLLFNANEFLFVD
jgi:hypothetical protein